MDTKMADPLYRCDDIRRARLGSRRTVKLEFVRGGNRPRYALMHFSAEEAISLRDRLSEVLGATMDADP